MKKIIVLCLLGITLSGCGGSSDTSAKQADDKPKTSTKAIKESKEDRSYASDEEIEAAVKRINDNFAKDLAGEYEYFSDSSNFGVHMVLTFDGNGMMTMTEKSGPQADGETDLVNRGHYSIAGGENLRKAAKEMTSKEVNAVSKYEHMDTAIWKYNSGSAYADYESDNVSPAYTGMRLKYSLKPSGRFQSADLDDTSDMVGECEIEIQRYSKDDDEDEATGEIVGVVISDSSGNNPLARTIYGRQNCVFDRK